MYSIRNGLRIIKREGLAAFLKRLIEKIDRRLKVFLMRRRHSRLLGGRHLSSGAKQQRILLSVCTTPSRMCNAAWNRLSAGPCPRMD
jgi:hypothetical protein